MYQFFSNKQVEDKVDQFIYSKVPDFDSRSFNDKKLIISKLIRGCKSCKLAYESGFSPVPSVLVKDCFAVFIGRNPNKLEAKNNELFPPNTGLGSTFESYLRLLGIERSESSILNMANCYCSGGRSPEFECVSQCVGLKKKEFEIIGDKYRAVFLMGNDACKWLLGVDQSVVNLQGKVYTIKSPREISLIPIMHPSHLLIDQSYREDVQKVLKGVRSEIERLRLIPEGV